MTEMWLCLIVLEKELLPKLEVRVLISATHASNEREAAEQTALDTPLPIDLPVTKRDGQTARELGYRVSCYKIQDIYTPQVVSWHF